LKKNITEKLQIWDAHYVGIRAMRERQRNSITLDELADEVMPLLSPYVHTTIEDQIPVFTEWVENALSGSTLSRKKNFSSRRKNC
jgi:hypothetical protein